MEWIRGEVLSLLLLVDVEYSDDVDDGRGGTGSDVSGARGAKADDWDAAAVRSKRARRWDFVGRFIVF